MLVSSVAALTVNDPVMRCMLTPNSTPTVLPSHTAVIRLPSDSSLETGTLPRAELPTARVTPEGRFVLGKVSFPAESIAESLRTAGKLSTAMRSYFQGPNDINRLIPDGSVVKPAGAEDMHAAWASLDDVFGEGEFRRDIHPWMLILADSSKERVIEAPELMKLRDLLRMGARIATACCAIDETLLNRRDERPVARKAFDWVTRRVDPLWHATQSYLRVQPLQDYHPQFLRIELDKWAQRIDLRKDGSPLVRLVCEREALARQVLESGPYRREVSLAKGVISSRLEVRDEKSGGTVLQAEHKLKELYSILALARSGSKLLQGLESQGVNLARLCALSSRESFVGMSLCLTKISPQTHIRIDSVDSWASRFDTQHVNVLSAEDVAELGALLLDAEAVLYTVSHLQAALLGEGRVAFWRSMWTKATTDKECRAALRLVDQQPSPLTCNCDEAGEVAATAALVLGYSSDERTGASWSIPESPLQSFAWILDDALSTSS